ncbi:MAG: hypothetical protein COT74_12715 [Bdellovibrionales bacterium CG10_big_fil_rev_8_21_14_0_10_45_34]|nr:MAG: hypothetical protein COT74_12715 [Bdellovibrionales bacterium CG10_big_fil_rev_8_21_14_0_10_45_34]
MRQYREQPIWPHGLRVLFLRDSSILSDIKKKKVGSTLLRTVTAVLSVLVVSSCGFVEESMKDLSSGGDSPLSSFQIQKVHGEDVEDEEQIIYGDVEPSLEWSESDNAARYIVRVTLASDEASLVCSVSVAEISTFIENCGIPENTLVRISVQAVGRNGKAKLALKRPYFMLDRTAPVVSFTSTPGDVVNVNSATFRIAATDSGSGVQRVECRLNTGNYTICPNLSDYTVSGLSSGAHTLFVRAYDQAGRVSDVISHNFNYDPTAIGAFSIAGVTGGSDTVSDICLTSGSSPTFSWGASTNADSYNVTVYESNGTTVACATENTTATTLSPAGCSLLSGNYKLSIEAARASGTVQEASGGLFDFVVDTAADTTNTTIAGTTPVVANGSATSSISVTLLNDSMCPLQGVIPTFSATDTGSTNNYGSCSASSSSGVTTCTLASTKAESKILSLTSPIAKSGSTVIFTHGPAASLLFTQQPSTTTVAGVAFAAQPIVHILDAQGNLIDSGVDSTAEVTLSITTGSGSLVGTVVATASGGVATFSGLSMTAAGAKVMTATKQDLSGSGGIGAIAQASSGFTITHAAASQLVFSTAPATHAKYSVAFNPQGVIQVRDTYGNVVETGADASATITISKQSGPGTLSGTLTESASSGVANFTGNGINNDTIGTIVIRATKPDLTGSGGVGVLTVDATIIITPISCDSGDFTTTCTITTVQDVPVGATISANNLTITTTGQLRNLTNLQDFTINLTGDLSITGSNRINANVQITAVNMNFASVSGDLVTCSGSISATGLGGLGGYRTGNASTTGLGAGGGTCHDAGSGLSCSGATHAGLGGGGESSPAVAAVYGSAALANTYGSGGGGVHTSSAGGNGGGRISLIASGTITAAGSTTSQIATACGQGGSGSSALGAGGGGSGGSIYIEATNISGQISPNVRGGASSYREDSLKSGGGSGGYISLNFSRLAPSIDFPTYGGKGGFEPGGYGSFYQNITDWSAALCDSGDLSTTCVVNTTKYVPPGSAISGSGNLQLDLGGGLYSTARAKTISIVMSGDITLNNNTIIRANLNPIQADTIYFAEAGSRIDASELGYAGGGGPSEGYYYNGYGPGGGTRAISGGDAAGGGGGHGGAGSRGSIAGSNGGASYGSANDPTTFGSGGAAGFLRGYEKAGHGGGIVNIIADTFHMGWNTHLYVNGGTADVWLEGGGGAGGTIRFDVNNLWVDSPATNASARGGGSRKATWVSMAAFGGGAGGGGRIWVKPTAKIRVNSFSNGTTGRFLLGVHGGTYFFGGEKPGEGSLYYDYATADSICDSGNLSTTCYIDYLKPIPNGYTISGSGNLVFRNTGVGYGVFYNPRLLEEFSINMGGDVTFEGSTGIIGNISSFVATNVTLDSSASINAIALGNPSGFGGATSTPHGDGTGAGSYAEGAGTFVGAAGGGGYGGAGGNGDLAGATGGGTYGSNTAPVDFGSGGAGNGGANYTTLYGTGGGRIIMNISGTLTLGNYAKIRVDGGSGTGTAGAWQCRAGGSGGSIYIQANNFSVHANATIHAKGGEGYVTTDHICGSGGGGRVSLKKGTAEPDVSLSNIDVSGGTTGSAGATGTIYQLGGAG